MSTLLTECVDAFETKLEELLIFIEHEKEFFQNYMAYEKGKIILAPKAIDKLEEMCNDKEKLTVTFNEIATALNIPVEKIANVIASDKNKTYKNMIFKSEENTMETNNFRCKVLTPLVDALRRNGDIESNIGSEIAWLTTNDKTPSKRKSSTKVAAAKSVIDKPANDNTDTKEPSDETPLTNDEPKTESMKKEKTVRKKKSKYLATKNDFNNLLNSHIDNLKVIRMFLLSLSDYKIEDIALMSDDEIRTEFESKYIIIETKGNSLIINKSSIAALDEVYILPN